MFTLRILKLVWLSFFSVVIVNLSQAIVINVPEDKAQIQEAIEVASNGDTVLVSDGVYKGAGNVNLDFKGKAITVRSENGAKNCIIDCENIDGTRGFYFHSNETPSSVVDGFTIRNGNAFDGAGIYCVSSAPTIINNRIMMNSGYYGGGIGIGLSFPVMINNVISGNSAYQGGGIYSYSSSLKVINNTITKNMANQGGGIFCYKDSNITITNTILWDNSSHEVYFRADTLPSTVAISYSDIQDGQAKIATNNNGILGWFEGNITSHPMFIDTSNDDYSISDFSPCIGAGTKNGAPVVDIVGNVRGTPPDIGAYENSLDTSLLSIIITSPNGGEHWYGGSVHNITWGGSLQGINHIRLLYSIDDGITYPNTIISSTPNDGIYEWALPMLISEKVRVKIIAEDSNNNVLMEDVSDESLIITLIDNVAPETNIELSGARGENEWWISNVKVTLSATDDISGVKETKYKIDNGEWVTYVNPFYVAGSIVYYMSEDNYGNKESERSYHIKIDMTPPSTPVVVDNGAYVILMAGLYASWTSKDDESGIMEYQYAVGTTLGGVEVVDWVSVGKETEITLDGSIGLVERGMYYFSVSAKNEAGLWSNTGWSDGISINSNPIIIRIPMDYNTIQAGMDEAINGDTVLVSDGVYTGVGNVNLDFKGKAIIVRSENGAKNCIIDCENIDGTRGFYFHSNETPSSVVDGFTIRNGNAFDGAGIYCVSSSPMITSNVIIRNTAKNNGGGIFCWYYSSPIITGNDIRENSADGNGGGIFCWYYSSAKMINNVTAENSADYNGGGVYCWYHSSPIMINNTMTKNLSNDAGGIHCRDNSGPEIINTILWNNSFKEISFYPDGGSNTVTIAHSNIQGDRAGISTNNNGIINWLYGNINVNPQFVDEIKGDYHLSDFSPCIGSGKKYNNVLIDIEGKPRPEPSDSNPDIGAYENVLRNQLPSLSVINVKAFRSVELMITDPAGGIISKHSSTIPSATYREIDLDNDGKMDDEVTIPYATTGVYSIVLMPKMDAKPNNTYTLDVNYSDELFRLADDVQIQNIPVNPYKFFIQKRTLKRGWNLISFSINKCFYIGDPPGNQPECVEMVNVKDLGFDTLADWFSSILTPANAWLTVTGRDGAMDSSLPTQFHTLKYMSPCSGYWVKIDESCDNDNIYIALSGLLFEPNCPIELKEGWNLVGFPLDLGYYDTNLPPSIALSEGIKWEKTEVPVAGNVFSSVDGKYSMVLGDDGSYNPALPSAFSSLHYIMPGCAYWIKMNESSYLKYSSEPYKSAASIAPNNQIVNNSSIIPTNTSMLIYGEVVFDNIEADVGTQIQVFNQLRVLCGQSAVIYKGCYGFMMVYGDDSTTPQIDGALIGDRLTFYVNGELAQTEKEVYWIGDKILLSVNLISQVSRPIDNKLGQNYPNPFNPDTWIPYQLKENANVAVKIYMSTGQLVRTLNLGYKDVGFYINKEKAAYWDGKNEAGESVSSGVYFYTIQAGNFIATKKMVIVR